MLRARGHFGPLAAAAAAAAAAGRREFLLEDKLTAVEKTVDRVAVLNTVVLGPKRTEQSIADPNEVLDGVVVTDHHDGLVRPRRQPRKERLGLLALVVGTGDGYQMGWSN